MSNHKRCICLAPSTDRNSKIIDEYIRDRLSGGPSYLEDLRDLVPKDVDISTARILIGSQHVCRTGQCISGGMTCCGMCTRKCPNRCVQDLIHKVCSYIYMGGRDGRYVSKLMEHPEELSYDLLLETFKWADTRIALNYEPLPALYKHPSTGKTHRLVDTSSGAIVFRDWPESGLCPFCVPPVTTLRRYAYHSNSLV